MINPLPDYDAPKLVSLLKKSGNYRCQLIQAMNFLARTGALGIYQNWLERQINEEQQKQELPLLDRQMTDAEVTLWNDMFKEPHTTTVTHEHKDHPEEIADKFHEAINKLNRYGISSQKTMESEDALEINYIIDVEREEEPKEEEIKQLIAQYHTERPAVGICLCVKRDDGKVLMHLRKGKHANGTWAFAGGHLEQFETFDACALRELQEEAGNDLQVKNIRYWTTLNTMYQEEYKHYVVVVLVADYVSGEPVITEPEKCERWEWVDWNNPPQPLMQGCQMLKKLNMNP